MEKIVKVLFLVALTACLESPELPGDEAPSSLGVTGFSYKKHLVHPDRHQFEKNVHHFIVKKGDCYWDNEREDCHTHRERAELRSIKIDKVNTWACYSFEIKIPQIYPEMSPKQTLGQWHDHHYGDLFSNRYENRELKFSQQLNGVTVRSVVLPFQKGEWNPFFYRFFLSHEKKGVIEVYQNKKLLYQKKNIQTLSKDTTGTYFKFGLYRSHLNRYQGPKLPTQVVSYRAVKRLSQAECEAR